MSDERLIARIRMQALAPHLQAAAEAWAARLALPLQGDSEFALQLGEGGLQLVELGPQAPGPVRVDFVEGAVAHRRLFGGGAGQMIAKAVGVQAGVRPRVLDATAGLGRDAFVLASLGCQMTLIERQPLIAALLEDGLARAARMGVATTHEGVDGLVKMPEFADIDFIFDATSAGAHRHNEVLLLGHKPGCSQTKLLVVMFTLRHD